jgi:hypothetical protein
VPRLESKPGQLRGTFQIVNRLKETLESLGIVFTENGVALKEGRVREEKDG